MNEDARAKSRNELDAMIIMILLKDCFMTKPSLDNPTCGSLPPPMPARLLNAAHQPKDRNRPTLNSHWFKPSHRLKPRRLRYTRPLTPGHAHVSRTKSRRVAINRLPQHHSSSGLDRALDQNLHPARARLALDDEHEPRLASRVRSRAGSEAGPDSDFGDVQFLVGGGCDDLPRGVLHDPTTDVCAFETPGVAVHVVLCECAGGD